MPVIKFDYFAYPHIKNKKLVAIYRPIIAIRVSAKHKIYPNTIECVVDSGADFNLLPATIGEHLGLDIKKGEKVTHMGIGNIRIEAYKHNVSLYVGRRKVTTEAHFSYHQKIPLLGRDGFFKYFKTITFNEKQLLLSLEY
ncbi:MAG: hypothetical protein H0W89_00615 [Candidatus Levybacteria bacterium]|nr:hypothetical protein [Candidatus Levybacteria bacterium]